MEWCATEIYKVINLYRQFELIWNYISPNYKRTDLKNNAWREIAKEMKRDVCETKRKIKHLRTAYLAEKKRVQNSKKSGSSAELIHEPRLFYYREMGFLDSVVLLRRTTSCLNVESVEVATEAIDMDSTLMEEISGRPIPSPSPPTNCKLLQSSSPVESSLSSISASFRKVTSRKSRTEAKFDSAVDAIIVSAAQVEAENVFTSFAKTIALQLQQLPLTEATETMSEIYSHVTSKLLANMKASEHAAQEPNMLEIALVNADINFEY